MDQRQLFFQLVDELAASPDPYQVAEELLVPILGSIDELRRELEAFLDDLVTLGETEEAPLPEAAVLEVRHDLLRMKDEPLSLEVLLCQETRLRCGRAAVPLLAAAIVSSWNWVEFAHDWLDSAERLRIRADALVCRLSGHRWFDRHGLGPCPSAATDALECALLVE